MAKAAQLTIGQPALATPGGGTVGLLGLVSLIWGAIFPLTHIAVQSGVSPITVATVRLVLAAIVLLGMSAALRSNLSFFTAANLKRLVPIAILMPCLPHLLMTWSQSFISSSQGVILMATVPLMTAFFTTVSWSCATTSRSNGFMATAMKLLPGFLGIFVLVGRSALLSDVNEMIGIAMALAASASCALAILMMSRLPTMPAMNVSTAVCTIAALALLPFFLATGPSLGTTSLSLEAVAALVFLGVVCTGLSSTLHAKLTSSSDAVFASLGFYLSPIVGLILSAMLLGESIDGFHVAAITLVLGSVYLVSPLARFDVVGRVRAIWR